MVAKGGEERRSVNNLSLCACVGVTIARIEGLKIRRLAFAAVISRFPRHPTIASSACTGVGYMDDDLERSTLLRKGKERSLQKSLHEKMESVRFDYRERMIVAAKKYLC